MKTKFHDPLCFITSSSLFADCPAFAKPAINAAFRLPPALVGELVFDGPEINENAPPFTVFSVTSLIALLSGHCPLFVVVSPLLRQVRFTSGDSVSSLPLGLFFAADSDATILEFVAAILDISEPEANPLL